MKNRTLVSLRVVSVVFATVFGLAVTVSTLADINGGADNPPDQHGLGISTSFGKWQNGTVTWTYNSTNAPAGRTDNTQAVAFFQAALQEWGDVCGINFVYTGVDDSADPNTVDGIVPIVWDAAIAPAAGQAGPQWSGAQDLTGPGHFEYLDGVVRLNPGIFATAGLAPDALSNNDTALNQTFLHEFGHLMGLGHSSDPVSLMWANPYNSLDHLRGDDIDSCRAMYGYSNIFRGGQEYAATAAGADPSDFVNLAAFSDANTPITTDNGTLAGTDTLAVRWQVTQGGYNDTWTQTVVDPEGFRSIVAESVVTAPAGGAFGIASFNRLRELPGLWTVYLNDSSGLISTLTIDVQTPLAAELEAPGATLTFSENPATRATSLTIDVATVSPLAVTANQVTVDWHIGTQGVVSEVVAVPGQASQNFTFADLLDHEVHVEVNDDAPRYTADGPNNIGPAGSGFQTLLPYFSGPSNLGTDSGGDNSSDIVLVNSVTGGVFYWAMHGNLIDPRGAIAVLAGNVWSVTGRGDYNGDGKSDLLWRNSVTQQLYYWQMDGRTIVSAAAVATLNSANWQIVGDGDYNGDGNDDVLFRHSVTGQVYLWQMNGATISNPAQIAIVASGDWQIVGDKDADGDGVADLTWFNVTTGQVYFWKMNGSTIVSAAQIAVVSDLNWTVVGDGDYNGDGNADLIWRHGVSGKVYYWQMSGAIIQLSSRISIVSDLDWSVVGNGDYNGDGKSDILWFNSTSRQVTHWQQDGFTTLRTGSVTAALDADWQIVNVN